MIGFNASFDSFKKGFFNTKKLETAINREAKRGLSKMGAYLRRVAKNSLKYKDGPGVAGQPPHVHRFQTRFNPVK